MINIIPPTMEKNPSIETKNVAENTGFDISNNPNNAVNTPPKIITHLRDALSSLNPVAIDEIPDIRIINPIKYIKKVVVNNALAIGCENTAKPARILSMPTKMPQPQCLFSFSTSVMGDCCIVAF